MSNEKQQRLRVFTTYVERHITGDEKGEAQIFLDHLFHACGWEHGLREAGATCEERVKNTTGGTSFADLVWKPRVVIEMKKRGSDLRKHYSQAFYYWQRLVPNRPRYAVLCNFDEFWVYDFNTQLDTPVDTIAIKDLPIKYGPLNFLFPDDTPPIFGNHQEEVTRQAADKLAACFNSIIKRKVDRELAQRFILQTLMALFAEDIGLLEKYLVTQLLDECAKPRDTWDLLGGLFTAMNNKAGNRGGRYKGVAYFNGGLFAKPAQIELNSDECALLREASNFNWSRVRPEIFGTIFEHSLGKEERHATGAHFTTPVDIMKVVGPTIVEPWRDAISAAKTLTEMQALAHRMQNFKVLDPACGSGNFLFIAYRELKRLEADLFARMAEAFPKSVDPRQRLLGFVNTQNFYGMDINPFAVEIAKVTMMLAHKLSIDELHVNEDALPLDNLDANIVYRDALIAPDGTRSDWPEADVIIGNPPFLGAKNLKRDLPTAYVNSVRAAYPEIPGMADLCVFWFKRANDQLGACTRTDSLAGRAGLVGTQNIRNGASRLGGLDRICTSGTIIEAVENQPWSGEANVNVSIVNWVKTKDPKCLPSKRRLWFATTEIGSPTRSSRGQGQAQKRYDLDFREVPYISSALSDRTDLSTAAVLAVNRSPQRTFQGVTTGYDGFVLKPPAAQALLTAEPKAKKLLRPYLIGRELNATGMPGRFLVDAFGLDVSDLAAFPKTLAHLQSKVLPEVQKKLAAEQKKKSDMITARAEHLTRWWTFWAQRVELRKWLKGKTRAIAASRTQRAPFLFHFVSADMAHGDKLQLFAFEDNYSFGILQSHLHCAWYAAKGSRLKNEVDFNYASEDVFATFPWPQAPTVAQTKAVAAAAQTVLNTRATGVANGATMRALYATMMLPGRSALKQAHEALDAAVLAAYGFSTKKDILQQLLELNHHVAVDIRSGNAVQGPGIPSTINNASPFITSHCLGK